MSSSTWFAPLRHPAPADLEQWLEAKAADGQILTDFGVASPLRMRFTDSAPARVRYALERRSVPAPIDYYRFREEQGWEHVGRAADVHVWSRRYTDERPAGFIGEDLDRRAGLVGVTLAVVSALALILAVALGAVAGLMTFETVTAAGIWIPAVVAAVVGVAAGIAAGAVALSRRSAARSDSGSARSTERESQLL